MDGTIITKKGMQLLIKLIATKGILKFTRVSIGTGVLPNGYDPASMTDLIQYRMDGLISGCEADGDIAKITMQISSMGIETGFTMTEMGIYAEDPDLGEILYAYLDMREDPQYIYAEGGAAQKFVEVTLDVAIEEATKITTYISPESMIKRKEFDEKIIEIELAIGNIDVEERGTLQEQIDGINRNITSIGQKIQSFESTKSEIANSALGKALGVLATGTWAQILEKLKAVVNRGALNWSGSNTTYSVPAGYYSGGTLDSRPSYNAGMTAADGRANTNSVNYKTGYNAGMTAADGRANTNSVNYKTGYNAGMTAADGRANANSVNYKAGYNAGVAAADGRANANSANYKAGFAAGAAPKGYEAKVICNPTSLNGSQSASASFNKPSGATRAVVSVANFSEADNRVVEASVNASVIAQFCSAHLAASNQGAWLTTFIVDVAGVSSITVTAKPSWPSSVNHYFRSAASVTWF